MTRPFPSALLLALSCLAAACSEPAIRAGEHSQYELRRGVYASDSAACTVTHRPEAFAAFGEDVFITLLPNEIAYFDSRCRFGALTPEGEDPDLFGTRATCRGEGRVWEREVRIRVVGDDEADFMDEQGEAHRYALCGG